MIFPDRSLQSFFSYLSMVDSIRILKVKDFYALKCEGSFTTQRVGGEEMKIFTSLGEQVNCKITKSPFPYQEEFNQLPHCLQDPGIWKFYIPEQITEKSLGVYLLVFIFNDEESTLYLCESWENFGFRTKELTSRFLNGHKKNIPTRRGWWKNPGGGFRKDIPSYIAEKAPKVSWRCRMYTSNFITWGFIHTGTEHALDENEGIPKFTDMLMLHQATSTTLETIESGVFQWGPFRFVADGLHMWGFTKREGFQR